MHDKSMALKGAFYGALAGAGALLLACVLIRSLGMIAHFAAPGQIEEILSQLSGAQIVPPVALVLLPGAAAGAFLLRGRLIALKAVAVCIVLLPLGIWFADVNSIRFAAAVKIVLDMVKAGVF